MKRVMVAVLLGFATTAEAGPASTPLSEPGSLALLGLGAAVAVVVAIRKRRK